jgi:hypothetical protein
MRSGQNPASWQSYLAPHVSLVEGYVLVVNWVGANFENFEHQVQSTILPTSLAYNISRVGMAHYNVCIYPPQQPYWGIQEHKPRYSSKCSCMSSSGVIIGDNPYLPPSSNSSSPPMEKVNI